MTLQDVIRLEPEIADLLKEAQDVIPSGNAWCANSTWYGKFKPRLSRMVGWARLGGPDELRTSEAYTVCYHTIYNALPDCSRECLCL